MDPTLERSFKGHKDTITSLAFHPLLKQVASAGLDSNVICYHLKPGLRSFQFIGHKGPVYSVDYHPTGNLLASSSADHSVKLWTPTVKGDVSTFKAHSGSVRSVEFSSTGQYLITASDDKSVKIWSSHKGRFQMTLNGHLNWVRSAHFSPDDKMAVSGSDDKTVKLWDLSSKTCIKSYLEHSGIILATQFHPSGHLIASCSSDRSINVWDIRTHKLLQHYGNAHGTGDGPAGLINSISFGGKAGEWMISTGGDGLVKIWDLQEGHLFYTLYGHKASPTTAAVFSRDEFGGKYFASAGVDAQVLLWKANFNLTDKDEEENEIPVSNKVTAFFKPSVSRKMEKNQQEPISVAEEFHLRPSKSEKSKTRVDHSTLTSDTPENEVNEKVRSAPLNPVQSTLPAMATALSQLANQMAALTQTMSWMEDRITGMEDRIIKATNEKRSSA